MKVFDRFPRLVSVIVTAGMLALNLNMPTADAAMISSEAVIQATQTQQVHNLLQDSLDREDVKAALVSLGVDPAQIQARVDALTNAEVRTVSQNISQLPAGGGVVGLLLVILLLVLIF